MKRVTSLGGVFFKTQDPKKMKEWYDRHLGIPAGQYGTTFEWMKTDKPAQKGFTAWSLFAQKSTYFQPSEKEFMVNYRVENLTALLIELKKEGVQIVGEMIEESYGKFAWIMDPEGNKIELWEPNDEAYEKLVGAKIEST